MLLDKPNRRHTPSPLTLIGIVMAAAVVVALCLVWESAEESSGTVRPGESVLRINEVMPLNRSTLLDEDGEYSDWIEIVNAGDSSVNLVGFALSDNKRDPLKWEFPPHVLRAGEHLVVFASNKNKLVQGQPLHTNFKLESRGESVLLTDDQGWLLDHVEYEEMPADYSYGRCARDPGSWQYFAEATPEAANSTRGWASLTEDYSFAGSQVVINEVLTSNRNTLFDEDGDFNDWIEIVNSGRVAVDLDGWGLSDDATTPGKWRFPALTVDPGGLLVVFASGKDRTDPTGRYLHTNFKLDATEDVLIFTDRDRQVIDQLEARGRRPGISYGRQLDEPSTWLFFPTPTPGEPNRTHGLATYPEELSDRAPLLRINEVMASNLGTLRDDDREFTDWIELYNGTADPVALAGYHLSDDRDDLTRWTFPAIELAADDFLVVFASGKDRHDPLRGAMHTSFGVRSTGEMLFLADPDGRIVDSFHTGRLYRGVSSGRGADGSIARTYFEDPTPGEPNDPDSSPGYAEPPRMSLRCGVYDEPIEVELLAASPTAEIRYTLDGSEPYKRSDRFLRPVEIDRTTVLRARVHEEGWLPSEVVTASYLIGEEHTVSVVSIAVDPDHMFHPARGIHSMGPKASPVFPHKGANFWYATEIPAHMEIFEPDGTQAVGVAAGLKIFGGYSRGDPQKSFLVTTRDRYGSDLIRYPLFADKPELTRHKAVILRTSGQDWKHTKIRDVLMTRLVMHLGIDYQAYRPAVLYINGDYWGLYNVREKINEHYVAYNHGLEPDEVNILQANKYVNAGSADTFFALKRYVKTHDLGQPEHYEYVQTQMDVLNFIDYQVAEVYFANTDNGNIRRWRDSSPDGLWRWILYDLDWGFRQTSHNTLRKVTDPRGTGTDRMFSTAIICNLLKNETFRQTLVERFAYHLDTTYNPDRVIGMIDELAEIIRPEIPRHTDRWGGSYEEWERKLEGLREFARERPAVVTRHVQTHFDLDGDEMALLFGPAEAY